MLLQCLRTMKTIEKFLVIAYVKTRIKNYWTLGDFFWKTVHPVKLPEGFEGELKVTSDKNISVTCPSNVFKRGVIHNFEMQKGNFFEKFSEHSCMLVAFHYILESKHPEIYIYV